MEDEALVICVQEFPFLYAKGEKDFMNTAKKKLAWKSIAQNLGVGDGEACEKRWRNLRDQFTREHRRLTYPVPSGSSSAASWRKPWDLYPAMSFLLEHIKHKQTLTSFSSFPAISTTSTTSLNSTSSSLFPTVPTPSTSRTSTPTPSLTSTSTSGSLTPDQTYTVFEPDVTLDLDIMNTPVVIDTGHSQTKVASATDKNSSTDSHSAPPERSLFSPPPDVYKRPKKDDGLDKILGEASSMVEKTMTIVKDAMTKPTTTDDDDLFSSVRVMFKMVPEDDKPDCLIELPQVVRKYVKKKILLTH